MILFEKTTVEEAEDLGLRIYNFTDEGRGFQVRDDDDSVLGAGPTRFLACLQAVDHLRQEATR